MQGNKALPDDDETKDTVGGDPGIEVITEGALGGHIVSLSSIDVKPALALASSRS